MPNNQPETPTPPVTVDIPVQRRGENKLDGVKRDARQAYYEVKNDLVHAAEALKTGVAHLGAAVGSADEAPSASTQPIAREAAEATSAFNVNIEHLQACLRGELSAVESYALAQRHAERHDVALARALGDLRDRHTERVARLSDRLREMGAVPATTSGVWGTFAKLVQGSANVFGDTASVAALEEGEDHGLALYAGTQDDCDMSTKEFIVSELLPEQVKSHEFCRSLKRFIAAA